MPGKPQVWVGVGGWFQTHTEVRYPARSSRNLLLSSLRYCMFPKHLNGKQYQRTHGLYHLEPCLGCVPPYYWDCYCVSHITTGLWLTNACDSSHPAVTLLHSCQQGSFQSSLCPGETFPAATTVSSLDSCAADNPPQPLP